VLRTLCGIPEITLLGTAEDWLSIRRRAEAFAEFELSHWTAQLIPVLDQIVKTVNGDVDREFWRSFYKAGGQSGGPYVSGWINVLFPFLQTTDDATEQPKACPNRHLAAWTDARKSTFSRGPSLDDFPIGLSCVPFIWDYLGTTIPMLFAGGFVGVSQNPVSGAVRPAIGWAIREK
jgi:hypothetical protein